MLDCSLINSALDQFGGCESSDHGYRVVTHCLYPSFEPVAVFVRREHQGFRVHDGSGAMNCAWHHGVDQSGLPRTLKKAAKTFGCEYGRIGIHIYVDSEEWLYSAIVSVSNASADAAHAAVGKNRPFTEHGLIKKTKRFFDRVSWKPETKLDHQVPGQSGKMHTYDLALFHNETTALIDAVVPHANSVAAKYLAFSDTENRMDLYKYAIYETELSSEDKVLISDVADLVAYESVIGTDGKYLLQ